MEKARLHITLLIAFIAGVFSVWSAVPSGRLVNGRRVAVEAIDSVSGEPVSFAAVYVVGTNQGAMADENGRAVLTVNAPEVAFEFSAMGYAKKVANVTPGVVAIRVMLSPTGHQLDEVTVRLGREHYSKRNNPAVEFMRRIREADSITDPHRRDFYNYKRYERITLGLNKVEMNDVDSAAVGKKPGRFDFVREHIDTSAVTGEPILPLAVKEKVSEVFYRRDPKSEKTYLLGVRSAGVDEIADAGSMQTLMEDIFREVELYDENVNILQNRFVSPLSRIAPDFYKFYLTDTVNAPDGSRLIELSFAPRNPASFGFVGRLYVAEGDTTMFVRKVRMNVSPSINLNFVEHLQIVQEFEQAPDGARLKTLDDFNVEVAVIKGTQGLYIHRSTAYKDHNFEESPRAELFGRLGDTFTDPAMYARDDTFWERERLVKATDNENRISQLMARLRGVKLYYYSEKILKIFFNGYVNTGKVSKFDFGPVNTLVSGNTIEGLRLRLGGTTTAALSPHWFARGYVAYGFHDRKWKYGAEIEYSFNEKRMHQREFPVHSIMLSEKYDVDQIGQHYLFTNPDNVFLSLKRTDNTLMTYRRQTRLDYTLELPNNFSIKASANLERQEATRWVPFVTNRGMSVGHYDQTYFSVELRYAPGEKFFQTKTQRIPVNLDAPVFILTHCYSPKGLFGAPFTVNKTEASVSKRFWLSAFGFVDVMAKGGHVWSRSPFLSLLVPNANLSYTIQPESFALMNPMEFINDSYVSWEMTYWANGALLNYIPYIKKLKLREAFSFRGWLGSLEDKNNPLLNDDLYLFPVYAPYKPMHGKPYMEISAGLDNLFKCLRVDYVWRLTYREGQTASARSGVRIALHVTF